MKVIKRLFIAVSLMATSVGAIADGKFVYENNSCAFCHEKGVAGAPEIGNSSAWKDRLKQDIAVLYRHAIEGFEGSSGVMPPKGGAMKLSDEEIKEAVDYMVAESQ